MNTFEYYTDLNSTTLHSIPFPEAIHFLRQREQLVADYNKFQIINPILEIPVYEWVSREREFTKFFYDIDAPFAKTSLSFQDLESCLAEHVCGAFRIPRDKIACICFTPSTTKLSFHITLMYRGKRMDVKKSAEILGNYLENKIPGFKKEFVDLAVYGRSQKFRAIFSSKRAEHRFKQPITEFIQAPLENALVTYVPEEDFPYPLQSATVKLPPKLEWFKAVLGVAELQPLWSRLRDVYENWFTVGASLWVETATSPQLYDVGLTLFQAFTANNKWSGEVVHKWRTAFHSQESALWNKIRKWIADFNETIVKEYDPLYKGTCQRIISNLNYTPVRINETDELQLPTKAIDFPLTTQTQYILWHQITHNEKFYRFWQEKLTESPDLSHLIALLDTDPVKAHYFGKLKEAEVAFGNSLTPERLPFGRVHLQNDEFLAWIRSEFSLPEPEEKVEIEKETLALAQLNYMHICEEIDPVYFKDLLETATGVTFVGQREYRNPAVTIRRIILSDALYATQYPYQPQLRKLFTACGENWNLFWLALSKFSRDILIVERTFHLLTNCVDDFAASEAVIALYPFWRRGPTGMVYVYDDTEGFWTTDESIKLGIITRFSAFLEFYTPRGYSNFATVDAKRKSTLKFIESSEIIREKGTSEFMETKKSGFYRFLFRNGYYNGLEDKFYPKVEVQYGDRTESFFGHVEVVFFGKIENDYYPITEESAALMEELNQKLFFNMHGEELGTYWKRCLAMALFGVRKKGFYEHIGDPNSGKSTEIDFIVNAFGSYVQAGSTQNFVNQPHDMRSIERQMGWLVPVWNKRLYLCSERTNIKDTCNTERMKGIASGQKDQHQVSQLYEKAQTVEVHFVAVFYVNKPLTWDNPKDPALIDRRNVITWQKVYVDSVNDPNTQLLKDPEAQNWAVSKIHQRAYIHLIIQAFKDLINRGYNVEKEVLLPKPAILVEAEPAGEGTALTTEEIFEQLLQWVVVTGDSNDYILTSELDEILQTHLDQIPNKSKQAIKNFLSQFGVEVESKQIRKNSMKVRVLTGMYARSVKAQEYSLLADVSFWKELMLKFSGKLSKEKMTNLKAAEEKIQSSSPLNFIEEQLIEEWSSETQKNYYRNHNSFQSLKRRRVQDE